MSLAHEKFIEWQKRRNAAPVHLDVQSTALVSIDMQEWPIDPTSPFWRYGERRTPGLRDYFLAQVERVVIPNLRRLVDFFRVHRLRVDSYDDCLGTSGWRGLDSDVASNERCRSGRDR